MSILRVCFFAALKDIYDPKASKFVVKTDYQAHN